MNDHESNLPLAEEWSRNFELWLAIGKQAIAVKEADDALNLVLDEYHYVDQKLRVATLNYNAVKREYERMQLELAERERLFKKELSCEK